MTTMRSQLYAVTQTPPGSETRVVSTHATELEANETRKLCQASGWEGSFAVVLVELHPPRG